MSIGVDGFSRNVAMMSPSKLNAMYGLSGMNDQQRASFASQLGSTDRADIEEVTGWKFHDRYTHDGYGTSIPFIAVTQDGSWKGNMSIDFYQNSNGKGIQALSAGFRWDLTSDDLSYIVAAAGLVQAGITPTYVDAALRAKGSGGGSKIPLYLKKSIFSKPNSFNNNLIKIGAANGDDIIHQAKVLKNAAPYPAALSASLTIYDIAQDRSITAGDIFQGLNTTAQLIFPAYGVIYGAVDLGTAFITGTSLTAHTKNWIDSKVTTSYDF
ncbi:hypothetical protein [Fulvivirga sediminis]|uniref:Uncharacterized protein n=1 Tax=Fulvivirga sediminis TaxID=2803949 RepID=A0A937K0W3_9BACT|nr:hypothetical protein [Fulvivirga sediminis]MBL3656710.1 hypothetical protein [Fulvivirga sediminis]